MTQQSLSPKELCRVCDDVSTGKHFGVFSCEACKSFFRRCIRSSASWVCRGGTNCCEIDLHTRNKCQHCRLQKCFDVGMNKNAVQEERRALLARERKVQPRQTKSSTSSPEQSPTTPKDVDTLGLPFPFDTLSPLPSRMESKSLNLDTKNQPDLSMLEILAKAEKEENSTVTLTQSLTDRILLNSTRKSLLSVISWVKEIPMFTQLPTEDQIVLIKATWRDINTLKLVHHVATSPYKNGINFQTDELSHLYLTDRASSINELIKECVASMENMQVDETELSYLKLISLMNPFICDLTTSGKKKVQFAQDVGLELLDIYIKENKPHSTHRMAKLLLFLNQVRMSSKDIVTHTEDQQIQLDPAIIFSLIS